MNSKLPSWIVKAASFLLATDFSDGQYKIKWNILFKVKSKENIKKITFTLSTYFYFKFSFCIWKIFLVDQSMSYLNWMLDGVGSVSGKLCDFQTALQAVFGDWKQCFVITLCLCRWQPRRAIRVIITVK